MTRATNTILRVLSILIFLLLPPTTPGQNAPHGFTVDDVLKLLKGQVSPHRTAQRALEQGITFQITPEVERELRQAGATDELIGTLRRLAPAPKPARIIVQTFPGAEVYLDDQYEGRASPQGRVVIGNAEPGEHYLRISLPGKKEFEQRVKVDAGEDLEIPAALVDLAGSIRVQTSAGGEVFLDNSSRGVAGAGGEIVIADVPAGPHELRVTMNGKNEFRQSVTVLAGQETKTEAALSDNAPKPGEVRENPKDRLKYAWIPPGTFMMGCSPGDSECGPEEKPSHQVTITKGLWIGRTEVTVVAYRRFVGSTGAQMPAAPNFNAGWNNQDMPIVNVTWDEATAFCGWAGGRLPTEAEWEYAARAGSTEARYGPLDEVGWYSNNSGQKIHEVAQKRPNAWNLYDTLGNVWEWVNDWYGENYYPASPERDPRGPDSGQFRGLRGGCWQNSLGDTRVSRRFTVNPTTWLNQGVYGFRCSGEVFAP